MTVATTQYGNLTTHIGTIAEVMAAINLANTSADKVKIFYNGTNMTGVVFGN